MSHNITSKNEITAIKVHQWLPIWDEIAFDEKEGRQKPEPYFYMFSISAVLLKRLTGIDRRRAVVNASRKQKEKGIQRKLQESRSAEISRYVKRGFPWSSLPDSYQQKSEYQKLQKPGWLPSAIVINILSKDDERTNKKVADIDLVTVSQIDKEIAKIQLPQNLTSSWKPKDEYPLEVIDGQHRLWAFESSENNMEEYQLPVIAFNGLDTSWRAYLFWTINIQPKKINPSLAFDLYPLLRTEDWLEETKRHTIYKNTRAQEIVEFLWSHQESPWLDRINMLAETKMGGTVTQSAWIASLGTSFLTRSNIVGGLFAEPVGHPKQLLPWNRSQQIAFIIYAGNMLAEAIKKTNSEWAKKIRSAGTANLHSNYDVAFTSPKSLLNTDQGIRGFLYIINDLNAFYASELKLHEWVDQSLTEPSYESVNQHLKEIAKLDVADYLKIIGILLSSFDWRTADAVEKNVDARDDDTKRKKSAYRGSGGYKLIRQDLLEHLKSQDCTQMTLNIAWAAENIFKKISS